MKLKQNVFQLPVLAALLLATAFHAAAADSVRYEARPGSKLTINGTSTVHDWTVESSLIGGFIEFDSNIPLDGSKPAAELEVSPKVQVRIPVTSIKSGTKRMDEVMHEAMNAQQHKFVSYTLKEMKPKATEAGKPLQFDTTGDLTVSGVTKEIDMVVTMESADGKLKTTGSKQLKMTDFGIKPPAPAIALGFIKTGDEVTVTFEWITVRKEAKATAAR